MLMVGESTIHIPTIAEVEAQKKTSVPGESKRERVKRQRQNRDALKRSVEPHTLEIPKVNGSSLDPSIFGNWSGNRAIRYQIYKQIRQREGKDSAWAEFLPYISERILAEFEKAYLLQEKTKK